MSSESMHDGHHHHHHEGHDHTHSHGNEAEPSPAPFLLKYMLDHNTQHAEELHKLMHQLEEAGSLESAEAVKRALGFYEQGNTELAIAVEHL